MIPGHKDTACFGSDQRVFRKSGQPEPLCREMLCAKLINIPQTTSLSRGEQTGESRHSPCDDEIEKGVAVPKPDSSAGFRFAMLNTGQPEQRVDDDVVPEAKPACVALVPVTPSAQWSQAPSRLPRPNPVFVTHLIATAAQVPQTRPLRRATAADAQSAYRAHRRPVQGAGIRTRQII